MGGKPWALVIDQAGPHKSRELQYELEDRGIKRILSPPYSPDFNAAEACFSICKAYFKSRRLNYAVNDRPFNLQTLILDSFNQITVAKVNANIKHSTMKLFGQEEIPQPDGSSQEALGFTSKAN